MIAFPFFASWRFIDLIISEQIGIGVALAFSHIGLNIGPFTVMIWITERPGCDCKK